MDSAPGTPLMETPGDLAFRKKLCLAIIDFLKREACDDPRQPGALAEYEAQLVEIERKIVDAGQGPRDVIIGLKTATLKGEAGRR